MQGINGSNEPTSENLAQSTLATAKMRCPNCQKLYSLNSDVILTALETDTDPKFQCVSCKTRFVALPATFNMNGYLDTAVDSEVQAASPEFAAQSNALDFVQSTSTSQTEIQAPHFNQPIENLRQPPASQPFSRRRMIEPAPLATRECPSCHMIQAVSSQKCIACDLIFARYQPQSEQQRVAQELELAGRRDLIAMWSDVTTDYQNQERHDKFVAACDRAGALHFAAMKYSDLLEAAPAEEIARSMRRRVAALASRSFERSPLAAPPRMRLPSFNLLLIALGSFALMIGIFAPQTDLAGVGIAMLALAAGLRLFLRHSPI